MSKVTPRQLKDAGIEVSALATAEARIAELEKCLHSIRRFMNREWKNLDANLTELMDVTLKKIERVYPPKQRKRGKR